MANTYVSYTGDGAETDFTITFQYLRDSHIKVTLDEVVTSAYSISGSVLTFDSAPINGAVILIKRVTPTASLIRQFNDGVVPQGVSLNEAFKQALYALAELVEGTVDVGSIEIGQNSLSLSSLEAIDQYEILMRTSAGSGDVQTATVAVLKALFALGGASELDVGTTVGTVAAGDDTRITGAVQSASKGVKKTGTAVSLSRNRVQAVKTTTFTTASTTQVDIPGLSVTITPSAVDSKITLEVSVNGITSNGNGWIVLMRDGTPICVGTSGTPAVSGCIARAADGNVDDVPNSSCIVVFDDEPATTSPVTYKVMCGTTAGNLYINYGNGTTTLFTTSSITATEEPQ